MKQKRSFLLPYLLALALNFCLLPRLIQDTGTAMLMMLALMPLLAFLTALACGIRHGFRPLLPLAAAGLFLLSIPLYYNASAWIYAVLYGAVTLAGMALGWVLRGRR